MHNKQTTSHLLDAEINAHHTAVVCKGELILSAEGAYEYDVQVENITKIDVDKQKKKTDIN